MIPPRCRCTLEHHPARFVALTGGPGAGKTAVLEIVRRHFCEHLGILPEAAGILFGGGFPRRPTADGQRAAQRAIYHVQRELEWRAAVETRSALVLCDRGTLDGMAYWPGSAESYLRELGTTLAAELERYVAVIHLRTPPAADGYNQRNPLRIEPAEEAARIDARIADAWSAHPRRFFVDHTEHFLEKARRAVVLIAQEIPPCCRVTGAASP